MIGDGSGPRSPWRSSELSSETKRAYLTLYSKLPQRNNHLWGRPVRRQLPPEDYKVELPEYMKFSTPTRPVVPCFDHVQAYTTKNSNRAEIIHQLGVNQRDLNRSDNYGSCRPTGFKSLRCSAQPTNSQRTNNLFLIVTSKLPQRKSSVERLRVYSVDSKR